MRYAVPLAVAALFLLPAQSWQGKPRVIDGDTIAIGKTSFRLWGIDAPELRHPGGTAAREHLARLIGTSNVHCEATGSVSYKRVVALCQTPTIADLGARMIADGYALDCPRFSGGQYTRLELYQTKMLQWRASYCRALS